MEPTRAAKGWCWAIEATPRLTMRIPETFVQELVARADVVDIVGRYVSLKKSGANFMGLCPFHGEKSPSFSVSPTKQFYHCFGCGKSGDAINFLMEQAGMTFMEAVHSLAGQYGLVVPEDAASPEDRARAQQQRQKQHTLVSVLEQAAAAYRKHLKESPRAVDYFKGRGVSGKVARQYGLGYAPPGWNKLASVFAHYDDPLLVESGLVISNTEEHGGEEKRYDRFRDRVMFPIRNTKGECIGFGGRVLGDDKPKYLNSPETPVFSKGRELYGLFEARTSLREMGYVLVTEGYMDVVALAQLGFPNAVATLGTACTADHAQKLFRFTDAVVFSFDGDAAGRRAARKALDAALPYATDVRSIKFLFLPPEHDPDSFIRAHGKEAFARYVSEATPLSRFLLESAREGLDLNTAEGRAHLSSNAKPLWQQLPDGALKMQLLAELAGLVQLPTAELTALWNPAGGDRKPPGRDGSWRNGEGGRNRHIGNTAGNFSGYSSDYSSGNASGNTSYGAARRSISTGRSGGRTPPHTPPNSRADHALRILLGHSTIWDSLGNEDHALLCALPGDHGSLMAWLETQLHEHGPLPWQALRTALAGHAAESVALRLMATAPLAAQPEIESAAELRDLLNRMLVERLKQQETEALEATKTDPSAIQRYQQLNARRVRLMAQMEQAYSTSTIPP